MKSSLDSEIHRQTKLALASRYVRHAVLALLVAAVVLAACGWLDQSIVFGGKTLWLFTGFLLAGLAAALTGGLLSLRRARGKYLLAELDRTAALDSGYVISTAAEFAGVRGSDAYEQAMLTRLNNSAESLIATAAPRHPWPGARIVAATSLGFAALAALVWMHGSQPLLRVLKPWDPQPYTRLTILPSDAPLPAAGEAFVVRGVATGRIPDRGVLRMGSGASRAFPITADGTFGIAFPKGLAASDTGEIRAGKDGVFAPLELQVRPPLKVAGYSHGIVPPRYSGQPARLENLPSFSILRASNVRYSVDFEESPAALRMVFENDLAPVDLQPDPENPLRWTVDLGSVARSFGYRLEASDAFGSLPLADGPQQVVALPDRPPEIRIAKENSRKVLKLSDTLKFEVEAKDDLGLAGIRVKAHRVGGEEGEFMSVARFEPTAGKSSKQTVSWGLDLRELGARPMDLVVVVFEAADGNDHDGPGLAYTDPFIFEVPEEAVEGEDQLPAGGGGGSSPEIVNPLEMQRQLYRETLQLALNRGKITIPEATRRQQEVADSISEMLNAIGGSDPEYDNLLGEALATAGQAAVALENQPLLVSDRRSDNPLRLQETTIDFLIQAARLEQQQKPPSGKCKKPGKKFTLKEKKPSSAKEEEKTEEEINKALAQIEAARKEQEEILKKMTDETEKPGEGEKPGKGEKPGEGEGRKPGDGSKPGEGEGKQPGQGKPGGSGQMTGGDNAPSLAPGETAGPNQQGAEQLPGLTSRQALLSGFSDQVAGIIADLKDSDNPVDPQDAADQMRRAAGLQREAAEALRGNAAGEARQHGGDALDALRRAAILTEALIERKVAADIDADARTPGFDDLIQGYSRRLSYDE